MSNGNLVLTRGVGDLVHVAGGTIEGSGIRGQQVSLRFRFPRDVNIERGEVRERKQREEVNHSNEKGPAHDL